MKKVFLTLLTLTLLLLSSGVSAVPSVIQHQGYVSDTTSALSGISNVEFKLYASEEGGSALWSENMDVAFDNGYYSVILGSNLTVDILDRSELYLGVTIEGIAEFSPRSRLTSVPYAFISERATSVEGDVNAIGGLYVDGQKVIGSDGAFATPMADLGDLPSASEENKGQVYFVTDEDTLYYSNGSEWVSVASGGQNGEVVPPNITSIDPEQIEPGEDTEIVINGQNFVDGCEVQFGNTPATSVTFTNSNRVTANTGADLESGLYHIRLTNPVGLRGYLADGLIVDGSPVWDTPEGSLGAVSDKSGQRDYFTLEATDPEGQTLTFELISGNMPPGFALDTETGVISGDPQEVSENTTFEFTVQVSDIAATPNSVSRTFSITVNNAIYVRILSMDAGGNVTFGDWDDTYDRVTNKMQDCQVRFDNRVSKVRHIEYGTNKLWFDFQPLHAWHSSWDAYAYVVFENGSRAGLGSSYRRGHASNVWQADRTQHAEVTWHAMDVHLYCASDYQHVASFDVSGNATHGSWDDFQTAVVDHGAQCKVRYDNRISFVPHVEYATNSIYLDFEGLYAQHDSWDSYAYIHVQNGSRAGLGASYRRGRCPNIWYKDRPQHSESRWGALNVDVFCQDIYSETYTLDQSGGMTSGAWADLHNAVVEGRDCRVKYDDRISTPEYIEYTDNMLEFDFINLHGFHNSWDSYAFVHLQEGSFARLTGNYRRGLNSEVWKKSTVQHAICGSPVATEVTVFCEAGATNGHVLTMDSSGNDSTGSFDEFYAQIIGVDQALDCKLRHDGRMFMPPYFEYGSPTDNLIYFDSHSLAGYHSGHESYSSAVVHKNNSTGIAGSYRASSAIWQRDRGQYALTGITGQTFEFICR